MRRGCILAAVLLLGCLAGCAIPDGSSGGHCVFADGSTGASAGKCNAGLTCLLLNACDPPDTNGPDCGYRCVDCSRPADQTQAGFCRGGACGFCNAGETCVNLGSCQTADGGSAPKPCGNQCVDCSNPPDAKVKQACGG